MNDRNQVCATSVKDKTPEVHELISTQEKHIQSLGGLLVTLEDRLRCVSRVEPPTGCDKESVPRPPSSTVMDKINDHNRFISACNSRVQEMIRLLEV